MDNSIATSNSKDLSQGSKERRPKIRSSRRGKNGIDTSTGFVQSVDETTLLASPDAYESMNAMNGLYKHAKGVDEASSSLSLVGYSTGDRSHVSGRDNGPTLTHQLEDSVRQSSTDGYRNALFLSDVNKHSSPPTAWNHLDSKFHAIHSAVYFDGAGVTPYPVEEIQETSWASPENAISSVGAVTSSWSRSPSAFALEPTYQTNSQSGVTNGTSFVAHEAQSPFSLLTNLPLSASFAHSMLVDDDEETGSSVEAPELISCSKTSPSSSSEDSQREDGLLDSSASHSDNPLYKDAQPGEDGRFHCPFVAEQDCGHRPTRHRCAYEKYLDSHFKPHRCKLSGCEDLRFSSSACLVRHEREAHGSHGHGVRPFLCFFTDCERSKEGMGFPRSWNRNDHMKRVHDYHQQPQMPKASGEEDIAKETRKRSKRASHQDDCGRSKRTKPSKEQSMQSNDKLKRMYEAWVILHSELHDTWHDTRGPLDLANIERIHAQSSELLSSAYKIVQGVDHSEELWEV